MNNEWIPAREAVLRDQQRQGATLVELTAAGLVRTRAATLVIGQGEHRRDVELSANFWRAMERLTGSAYRQWNQGIFKTGIMNWLGGGAPAHSQTAVGVQFNRADLDVHAPDPRSARVSQPQAVASVPAPAAQADKRQGRGGRPRNSGWNDWVAEMTVAVHKGEIKAGITDTAVLAIINEKLATRGIEELGRSTVQGAITAVLTRLEQEGIF